MQDRCNKCALVYSAAQATGDEVVKKIVAALVISVASLSVYFDYADAFNAEGLTQVDTYTLRGQKNFLTDFVPVNPDGTINVVVEIPTGTTAKWEVTKPSGDIKWEFKSGAPRVVKYLGYPGNYGMVPQTLLPHALGGDGDPLDVIVLAPTVPRGTPVRVNSWSSAPLTASRRSS